MTSDGEDERDVDCVPTIAETVRKVRSLARSYTTLDFAFSIIWIRTVTAFRTELGGGGGGGVSYGRMKFKYEQESGTLHELQHNFSIDYIKIRWQKTATHRRFGPVQQHPQSPQ